jgi:PilZ domain-containing protein
MVFWNRCYERYGDRAAVLTLAFPGLGQLHNRQFFRGVAIAVVFCILSLCYLWLAMTQLGDYQSSLPEVRGSLLLLMLITWEASLFEAFFFAIRRRKRDSKRVNTQVPVLISGVDVYKENFAEVVTTKNLSKTGACLVMPRDIKDGALLSLEFESKRKCQGRVIWQRQRETEGEDEIVAGVEFLKTVEVF